MKHSIMSKRMVFLVAGLFILVSVVLPALLIVGEGLRDEIAIADVGVVPGSKVNPDGSLSDDLKVRLNKAVDLYRKHYFNRLIVSGGMGREGFDEAVKMREYLIHCGIPDSRIVRDSNGVDTYHTAAFAAKYLMQSNLHSVFVVSRFFHVPRVRLACRRFGIKDVYTAHAGHFEWIDLISILREVGAWYYYWFRDYRAKSLDMERLRIVSLTPEVSNKTTVLPSPFHDDPADSILLATAREEKASILTKDERIHTFSKVRPYW